MGRACIVTILCHCKLKYRAQKWSFAMLSDIFMCFSNSDSSVEMAFAFLRIGGGPVTCSIRNMFFDHWLDVNNWLDILKYQS
jgi:hypothetical protein